MLFYFSIAAGVTVFFPEVCTPFVCVCVHVSMWYSSMALHAWLRRVPAITAVQTLRTGKRLTS